MYTTFMYSMEAQLSRYLAWPDSCAWRSWTLSSCTIECIPVESTVYLHMQGVTKLCVQYCTRKADRGSHQERLSSLSGNVRGQEIYHRVGAGTPMRSIQILTLAAYWVKLSFLQSTLFEAPSPAYCLAHTYCCFLFTFACPSTLP